jgi:ribosomal protein S21
VKPDENEKFEQALMDRFPQGNLILQETLLNREMKEVHQADETKNERRKRKKIEWKKDLVRTNSK